MAQGPVRPGNEEKVKVTYIEHSGFLLETDKAGFLFDYYRGEIPEINPHLPLFVFVSHKHQDHYNPEIFKLMKKYPSAHYILSRDVPVKWQIAGYREQGISLEEHITVMKKHTTAQLPIADGGILQITTLKSTDEGVAYLLSCDGQTFYHGGDYNLWVWEGESDQYNRNMEQAYYGELETLKGRHIDVAFVPLDPRLGGTAFLGLKTFLDATETVRVFPMHMWQEYDIIRRFLQRYPEYEQQVMKIQFQGQGFELN